VQARYEHQDGCDHCEGEVSLPTWTTDPAIKELTNATKVVAMKTFAWRCKSLPRRYRPRVEATNTGRAPYQPAPRRRLNATQASPTARATSHGA